MRIVFCGSGTMGAPTLRALAGGGHELAVVVTQPPRPAGRGGRLRETPIAELAAEWDLPAAALEDINAPANVAELAGLAAEVMVVADFGQMIRGPVREAFVHEAINLHASLLPELRGAAPVNWALIRGHETTGVSVFRLADSLDTGPVFCRRRTPIGPDERADELAGRLAEIGAEAVAEALEMLAAGAQPVEQDHARATPAPKLTKADGRIDFSAEAAAIVRRIHGTWPWPGARARYVAPNGKAVDVILARAAPVADAAAGAAAGEVCDDLTVAAGAGRVRIIEIKPAGGKLMDFKAFANGYRVGPGAKFAAAGP